MDTGQIHYWIIYYCSMHASLFNYDISFQIFSSAELRTAEATVVMLLWICIN